MSGSTGILWPEHYSPSCSPVHVRNELDTAASRDAVWAWLIRAPLWPNWYSNAANVKLLTGTPPDLAAGTRFRWRTFGVTIESTVLEFVPGERIAWDAHAIGVDAYHAWLLTDTVDGGCRILTEETQHGFVARAGAMLMPKRMGRFHQIWLEGLDRQASSGLPGSV